MKNLFDNETDDQKRRRLHIQEDGFDLMQFLINASDNMEVRTPSYKEETAFSKYIEEYNLDDEFKQLAEEFGELDPEFFKV